MAASERVDEPGVGARGVVGDEVQHDGDASLRRLGYKAVEVGQSAKVRVDAVVVRHVVAPVFVG